MPNHPCHESTLPIEVASLETLSLTVSYIRNRELKSGEISLVEYDAHRINGAYCLKAGGQVVRRHTPKHMDRSSTSTILTTLLHVQFSADRQESSESSSKDEIQDCGKTGRRQHKSSCRSNGEEFKSLPFIQQTVRQNLANMTVQGIARRGNRRVPVVRTAKAVSESRNGHVRG